MTRTGTKTKTKTRTERETGPRALEVLRRARAVPEGFVTTYGDLCPEAPRFAGAVMSRFGDRVPWHRIVRADGSLAVGEHQRRLLEAEGVPFRNRRVEMGTAWVPAERLDGGARPRPGGD